MINETRRLIASGVFAATLVGGLTGLQSSASADLFSRCAIRSGNMRFWDASTDRCGYVAGWNSNWGSLPGGWNDRAEQFGNDGNTHSVCVYQDAGYGGTDVLIPRGYALDWSNIVSSNSWTTGSGCP